MDRIDVWKEDRGAIGLNSTNLTARPVPSIAATSRSEKQSRGRSKVCFNATSTLGWIDRRL